MKKNDRSKHVPDLTFEDYKRMYGRMLAQNRLATNIFTYLENPPNKASHEEKVLASVVNKMRAQFKSSSEVDPHFRDAAMFFVITEHLGLKELQQTVFRNGHIPSLENKSSRNMEATRQVALLTAYEAPIFIASEMVKKMSPSTFMLKNNQGEDVGVALVKRNHSPLVEEMFESMPREDAARFLLHADGRVLKTMTLSKNKSLGQALLNVFDLKKEEVQDEKTVAQTLEKKFHLRFISGAVDQQEEMVTQRRLQYDKHLQEVIQTEAKKAANPNTSYQIYTNAEKAANDLTQGTLFKRPELVNEISKLGKGKSL